MASRFKGYLFDLDGVLLDTAPAHIWAFAKLMEPYGIPFDPIVYQRLVGLGREQIILGFLPDLTDAELARLMGEKETWVKRYLEDHGISPFPGVIRLLETLRGQPVAVATGGALPLPLLRAGGLEAFFDVVVDRTDVDHGKPSPETYLLAASRLDLEPSTCLAIEDSEVGVASAKAAGCTVVGLTTSRSRRALGQADVVFGGFPELQDWLTGSH